MQSTKKKLIKLIRNHRFFIKVCTCFSLVLLCQLALAADPPADDINSHFDPIVTQLTTLLDGNFKYLAYGVETIFFIYSYIHKKNIIAAGGIIIISLFLQFSHMLTHGS